MSMSLEILRSKIHQAWVTGTNPDYIGSIAIDQELMDLADIGPHEKVLVCNITNGARYETYALPAPRNSGIVSVQGASARLAEKGDCLIILAFGITDTYQEPRQIMVDRNNKIDPAYIPMKAPMKANLENTRNGRQIPGTGN